MVVKSYTYCSRVWLGGVMVRVLDSQWNIRGLQANREELDMLLSHTQPSVICLQETFLKENKTITFKGYSSFHSFAQK